MSIDDMIVEFQDGMLANPTGSGGAEAEALRAQIERMNQEREEWARQHPNDSTGQTPDQMNAEATNMAMMEKEIAELMPKTKQLKEICNMMGRDFLSFDCSFQRGSIAGSGMGAPTVKVKVTNHSTHEHVFIDPFEFTKGFSVLRDERQKIQGAIENGREYESPKEHDPVTLLFDNTFYLGAAVIFPEFLAYNLQTDDEDKMQDITSVGQGARLCGKLEIMWNPKNSPDEDEWDESKIEDILDADELIGKQWTAECCIKGAFDLPLMVDIAYCEYEFWEDGAPKLFTTEAFSAVEGAGGTSKPEMNHKWVHTVEKVDQGFLDFLAKPLEVKLYVSPGAGSM